MKHRNITAVVDAGNTAIKLAIFKNDALVKVLHTEDMVLQPLIDALFPDEDYDTAICSVRSEKDTAELAASFNNPFIIDSHTPVPFKNNYKAETLGTDRLANAAFLYENCPTSAGVTIDIGTCIKFDILHLEKGYLGGSISPGIDLRYKALNDYTGKLPLLSGKGTTDLVGTDTTTSIQSGVINGMKAEIEGLIAAYSKRFSDLTFFVTGGDAKNFDIHSKNNIFADENLTLRGIYKIFKHHA